MSFNHLRVSGAVFYFVLSSLACRAALGQQTPESFPKGLWTLQLTDEYINSVETHHPAEFFGGSVGAAYYFFNRAALVMEVPVYYVDQLHAPDAAIGGFALLARYHLLEFGKTSIFADGGAGSMLSSTEIPHHGTNFNFTPQAGMGMTYRATDKVDFLLGARIFHLSNAGIRGSDRNPSIGAAEQIYLGLLFRL